MVSRIAPQRRNPTAVTAQKQPTAAAKKASSAQAASKGWAPAGAGKAGRAGRPATSLEVTGARIGDGPTTTPKIALPKGFTAQAGSMKHSESINLVDGRVAKLDVDWATLSIKGPNGKSVEIAPIKQQDLKDMKDWFHESWDNKPKAELEWGGFPEWDASRTLSGAGTAGKLVSIMDSGNSYTGGAHPNHGSSIATYDASTGKQVNLDQLLPQATVDALAKNIFAKLQTLKSEDGIDGQSFMMGGTEKDVRDAVNTNFALATGKNGKVNIEIAWESGIHALGGQMAHFTVPAPDDAAFKKAIGAQ